MAALAGANRRRLERTPVPFLARLKDWPSRSWLGWLDGRLGLYLIILGAANGFLSIGGRIGWDFDVYWAAGSAVAGGRGAYASTLALGADQWGTGQTYVYPPFVAYLLAPLTTLPEVVGFTLWTLAGVAAVIGALRVVESRGIEPSAAERPHPAALAFPRLFAGLGVIWITLFVGQVNLFVLAALLLAVGCRDDRLAGMGLALAMLLRVTPVVFGMLFLLDRRWRAAGWAALAFGAGALVGLADWAAYAGILRSLATLPSVHSIWQTSLAAIWPPLAWLAAAAVVVVLVGAQRRPDEMRLLRGTALGLGLILIPGTSWFHWVTFAIAPLLVDGDRVRWGRGALLAFLAVSWVVVPVGSWATTAVASATLIALTARVLRSPRQEHGTAGRIVARSPGEVGVGPVVRQDGSRVE